MVQYDVQWPSTESSQSFYACCFISNAGYHNSNNSWKLLMTILTMEENATIRTPHEWRGGWVRQLRRCREWWETEGRSDWYLNIAQCWLFLPAQSLCWWVESSASPARCCNSIILAYKLTWLIALWLHPFYHCFKKLYLLKRVQDPGRASDASLQMCWAGRCAWRCFGELYLIFLMSRGEYLIGWDIISSFLI